uniref:Uncharacterized protein n=1 Tax=Candidatus Kentrum eta TaxID=2126337 RepID=A0A450UDV2_9GAMM|nr:MAG: hypothetical protein BECKH772A_GA0070896_1001012 [Candidatus Kentron sp. H]VFJ90696.1 MAG: hypothetical protein BECKH772B_GA0070898_1001112 [Candidatus Kentron sp. H]VFJ96859.1 MAG: hypothetical protein BECKH772C_GA0070978_1000912 [Candidatus Kentron sp. H]
MNPRLKTILFAVFIALSLPGCFGGYYVVDPVFQSAKIDDDPGGSLYVKGENKIDTQSDVFKAAYASAKNDEQSRNELLGKIILLSDEVCQTHKGDILGNAATVNVGLGGATTLFSSLGAVIGGETAKAGLSAAASVTNASRSLINEEVYFNAFAIAIIKAIDGERKVLRRRIRNGLEENVSEYSIEQGLLDVHAYHNACSLQNGLKVVSEAIDRRKPTTTELREKISFISDQIKANKNDRGISDNSELEEELQELQRQYSDAKY